MSIATTITKVMTTEQRVYAEGVAVSGRREDSRGIGPKHTESYRVGIYGKGQRNAETLEVTEAQARAIVEVLQALLAEQGLRVDFLQVAKDE